MAFSESAKLNVKRKAHFTCCWCRDRRNKVEVHHIIPQAQGGSDDEGNAAPLCGSCHDLYGGNPDLGKEIRQRRDQWYEICLGKQTFEYRGGEPEGVPPASGKATQVPSACDWDEIRSEIEATFDIDKCFIRQRELDDILNLIRIRQCVELVGDYGSGKTTLLKRLQQSPDLADYVVGYLDLTQESAHFPSVFWRLALVSLDVPTPKDVDVWVAHERLSNQLRRSRCKRYILCLDNIDRLVQNPMFDGDMFGPMRSLPEMFNLTFVVASRISMMYSWPKKTVLSSPFYNIFSAIPITEVSERRARKLLDAAGLGQPECASFSLRTVKQRLPLDLLIVAYHLLTQPPRNSEDYERIQCIYESVIDQLHQKGLR